MKTELKIVENGLVSVYETSTGEKVVYGSELHKILGTKSNYREWVKRRISDADAVDGEDYTVVEISTPSKQTQKEYIIKLDTAKEMAMLERNEKGKQVRRYFIQLEKKYKEHLSNSQDMTIPIQQFMERQQSLMEELVGIISDRLDALETKKEYPIDITVNSGNKPFSVEEDENARRKKILNIAVAQMAKAYGWTKSFAFHRLYKTLEEVLDIGMDGYVECYKEEIQGDACTLDAVVASDRLYATALRLCNNTINKMSVAVQP